MFMAYANLNEPLLLYPNLSSITQVEWNCSITQIGLRLLESVQIGFFWLYLNFHEALVYYPIGMKLFEVAQNWLKLFEVTQIGMKLFHLAQIWMELMPFPESWFSVLGFT